MQAPEQAGARPVHIIADDFRVEQVRVAFAGVAMVTREDFHAVASERDYVKPAHPMHIELPIVGGHILMGTDALECMGQTLTFGTNTHINLEPDERQEAERLFHALSEGGKVTMPLTDMFWGAYFGSLTDKYGVQWMLNCPDVKKA